MDNLVWYVCYGSNLLEERFMNYIQGGLCRFNNKYYDGCSDKTPPKVNKAIEIPYDMFYAKHSHKWDGSSVCFLDVNKPGYAYGRAWLIKESQLDDIKEQEGPGWYPEFYPLKNIDGIKAVTLTNPQETDREPFSCVFDKYKNVLYLGLKETFPNLTDEQINAYLESCGKTE